MVLHAFVHVCPNPHRLGGNKLYFRLANRICSLESTLLELDALCWSKHGGFNHPAGKNYFKRRRPQFFQIYIELESN